MDIRFSGKNLSLTKGMKDHMEEKLVKLEKYSPRLVEAHVILEKEKYLYKTEITLLAKNLKVYGEDQCKENIFSAMDKAYIRVEKQLKKYREKLKDHHRKNSRVMGTGRTSKRQQQALEKLQMQASLPDVVLSQDYAKKPMSIEESNLQLHLSKKPFFVFVNEENHKVNIIYKREDGSHGLIEPDV